MVPLKFLNTRILLGLSECAGTMQDRGALALELKERKKRLFDELVMVESAQIRMRKHYAFLLKTRGKMLKLKANLRTMRRDNYETW